MNRFAFICHPLDFQHLQEVDAGVSKKSPRLVRQMMAQLPPHHVQTIEITSATGERTTCELICVWLLPDQFGSLDTRLVETRLREAFQIARHLACDLVGLGAYTKGVGLRAYSSVPSPGFHLTTGNTLTAALATRNLERLIEQRDLLRDETELTVVGATGVIGHAVMRAIAPRVARLNLVGRSFEKLAQVKRQMQGFGCSIRLFNDAKLACRESDLIFLATSEPGLLIQATDLAVGANVVDVSKPVNIVPDSSRTDVTILDCAMVRTPPRRILKRWVHCFPDVEGLSSPEVFACYAETMVLSLENRKECYSAAGPLDLGKFSEILQLSRKHGFTTSLDERLPDEEAEGGRWKYASPRPSMNFPKRFGMGS